LLFVQGVDTALDELRDNLIGRKGTRFLNIFDSGIWVDVDALQVEALNMVRKFVKDNAATLTRKRRKRAQ
jgi:hypothetical protein